MFDLEPMPEQRRGGRGLNTMRQRDQRSDFTASLICKILLPMLPRLWMRPGMNLTDHQGRKLPLNEFELWNEQCRGRHPNLGCRICL